MSKLGPGLAGTEAMRLKPQASLHNLEITNETVIHSVSLRQMLWCFHSRAIMFGAAVLVHVLVCVWYISRSGVVGTYGS